MITKESLQEFAALGLKHCSDAKLICEAMTQAGLTVREWVHPSTQESRLYINGDWEVKTYLTWSSEGWQVSVDAKTQTQKANYDKHADRGVNALKRHGFYGADEDNKNSSNIFTELGIFVSEDERKEAKMKLAKEKEAIKKALQLENENRAKEERAKRELEEARLLEEKIAKAQKPKICENPSESITLTVKNRKTGEMFDAYSTRGELSTWTQEGVKKEKVVYKKETGEKVVITKDFSYEIV